LKIFARLPPELTVVGSVNLDLVARVGTLPRGGETLTAHAYERIPGGKGANQAVAAARLGARVRFVGAAGNDEFATEALANLRDLELDVAEVDEPTGIALIVVDDTGENQIVVVPGANARLDNVAVSGAALCQLEIPDAAIESARTGADWLCVNAAPARPLPVKADLVVANRYEVDIIGERAVLYEGGTELTRAQPPHVEAVDGTAAGDAFTACLVVSHLEGRDWDEAMARACAAGAIAASRFGAQPSLPSADDVDAILRG
jgi:ribokinase